MNEAELHWKAIQRAAMAGHHWKPVSLYEGIPTAELRRIYFEARDAKKTKKKD